MTEREIAICLALERVTFLPAHPHKRFARDMAAMARNAADKPLSEKQRKYLVNLAWRYRRQMPAELAYPLVEGEEGIRYGAEVLPGAPPP